MRDRNWATVAHILSAAGLAYLTYRAFIPCLLDIWR